MEIRNIFSKFLNHPKNLFPRDMSMSCQITSYDGTGSALATPAMDIDRYIRINLLINEVQDLNHFILSGNA